MDLIMQYLAYTWRNQRCRAEFDVIGMYSETTRIVDDEDTEKQPQHSRTIQINTDVNVRKGFTLAIILLIAFTVTIVNVWIAIVAIGNNNIPNGPNSDKNVSVLAISEDYTQLNGTIAPTMLSFLANILSKFKKMKLNNNGNKVVDEYVNEATLFPVRKTDNETNFFFQDYFKINLPVGRDKIYKSSIRLKRFTSIPSALPISHEKHRFENNILKNIDSKVDVEKALNSIQNMLFDEVRYPFMKEIVNKSKHATTSRHFKPIPPYFHTLPHFSFLTTTPANSPSLFIPPPPNKYLPITKPIKLIPFNSKPKKEIVGQRQGHPSDTVNEGFLRMGTFTSGLVSFSKLNLSEPSAEVHEFIEPKEDEQSWNPLWIFVNPERDNFQELKSLDLHKKSNNFVFSSILNNQYKDSTFTDILRQQRSQDERQQPVTLVTPVLNNSTYQIISVTTIPEIITSTADESETSTNLEGASSNMNYRVMSPPIFHSLYVSGSPLAAFERKTSLLNKTDISSPLLHSGFKPIFDNQIRQNRSVPDPVSIQKRLYFMEVPSDAAKVPFELELFENKTSNNDSNVNKSLALDENPNGHSEDRTFHMPPFSNFREPRNGWKDSLDEGPRNGARSKFITFAYEILKQKRQVNPSNDESGRHLVLKLANDALSNTKTISSELVNKINTFLKIYFDPNNINILQNIQKFVNQHQSV